MVFNIRYALSFNWLTRPLLRRDPDYPCMNSILVLHHFSLYQSVACKHLTPSTCRTKSQETCGTSFHSRGNKLSSIWKLASNFLEAQIMSIVSLPWYDMEDMDGSNTLFYMKLNRIERNCIVAVGTGFRIRRRESMAHFSFIPLPDAFLGDTIYTLRPNYD